MSRFWNYPKDEQWEYLTKELKKRQQPPYGDDDIARVAATIIKRGPGGPSPPPKPKKVRQVKPKKPKKIKSIPKRRLPAYFNQRKKRASKK